MNQGVESEFNAQLTASIDFVETFLHEAMPVPAAPTSRDPFYFIGNNEHHRLLQILGATRDLSFKLQHAVVSSRLFVMTVSWGGLTDDVLGTYAFGLEKVSEGGRSILLQAKVITGDHLRAFVDH